MPFSHDNAVWLSINDLHGSCATALALATRRPIICRRLGFRSGCCKYVEQCKTAIYWDLALDFILVRFRRTAFIFSKKFINIGQILPSTFVHVEMNDI